MIYPIVPYGDPILRKIAQEIDPEVFDVKQFVADLYETMYEAAGVGLAAPQVGKSIRIFVVDGRPLNDPDEDDGDDFEPDPSLIDFKMAFINPEITATDGGKWVYEEGCLSIPGIRSDVLRPERITINYFDEDGSEFTRDFDGMAARIIQHEYDHLEGKLFTDYMPILKRQILKKRLADITKGNVKVDYRMRFPK